MSNSLTLVRDLSYSHDQDHVHVHSHAILLPHWKIARISIHSQNKTPSSIMTLSPRLSSRIWAIQKEIKDAYPKKVCHMPKRHDKKKSAKKKRKDAYPKKVCHMSTRHVKKKKKRKKKNIYI